VDDTGAARAVVEEYVAACRALSVERLAALFHPDARMSGYLGGQCLVGSPEPFLEAVRGAAGADTGGYSAQITSLVVTGSVAAATLEERGFLGMDFVDHFHLVKLNGGWKIVSKTFTTR
jgi:ketosteroid isomerase-like protein